MNGAFLVCFSGMARRLEWLNLEVTGASGERAATDFKLTAPGDLDGASFSGSEDEGQSLESSRSTWGTLKVELSPALSSEKS